MEKTRNSYHLEDSFIPLYERNITEFDSRHIKNVYKPKNIQELQDIVKNANQKKEDLYVFSTGKNWGLGSKVPVKENSSVLDLSDMNRIIEVNEKYRYAIIEPGVTQNDLYEYLQENLPNLKFPITGSAKSTSVIGNMLERGAAAFAHRSKLLVAIEALTANGKLVKTGFWHYANEEHPLALHYPPGHGPDLRGLFVQSNLAIVTKMAVRIVPKADGVFVFIPFKEALLQKVTHLLRDLYEQKILDDGIVITNLNDPRTTTNREYNYSGNWLAVGNFVDQKGVSSQKKKIIRKHLRKANKSFFFVHTNKNRLSLRKGSFLPFVFDVIHSNSRILKLTQDKVLSNGETLGSFLNRLNILKGVYHGKPTNYSIQTMAEMNGTVLTDEDLDNSNILGLTVSLPAVPFTSDDVEKISEIVNMVSKKWNVQPFHNLASIDDLCFEGFYRIYFDRKNKEQVKVAHQWSKELNNELKSAGYYPYRMDIAACEDFAKKGNPFWEFVHDLKLSLDPNQIISDGKYNIKNS